MKLVISLMMAFVITGCSSVTEGIDVGQNTTTTPVTLSSSTLGATATVNTLLRLDRDWKV